MKQVIALVIAASVASGCATRGGNYVVVGGGGVVTALGVGVLVSSSPSDEQSFDFSEPAGKALFVGGIVLLVAGMIGLAMVDDDDGTVVVQ